MNFFEQGDLVLSDSNGAPLSDAAPTSAVEGGTVYAQRKGGAASGARVAGGANGGGSFCKFVTVVNGDAKGTLLLENPKANCLERFTTIP